MKKLTKKNNKGFSLVELIVVVLIMAIIAVALAPQVTKWVENSRQSSDAQLNDSLISACQIVATQATYSNSSTEYKLTVNTSGVTPSDATFGAAVEKIYDYSKAKGKSATTGSFEVKLQNGKVSSTFGSLDSDLK